MGARRSELAGTVARGDVGRQEPESQSGSEPSDRIRDRQQECKSKKTEEKERATGRPTERRQQQKLNARRRGELWRRARLGT
jgi:hypothetical protein